MFLDWTRRQPKSPSMFFSFAEISKAWVRVIAHKNELSEVALSPGLPASTHIVVTVIHNEAHRLPYFIEFYRKIGFNEFIFIDNKSEDSSIKWLKEQEGCSIFSASGSYKNSRFGMDWVNFLLGKYCASKWILHADADEFLCFPQSIGNDISSLTNYLDARGDKSMNCLLLDLYSKTDVSKNHCDLGESPLDVLRYYDAVGYMIDYHRHTKTRWIKGGVRGRKYFLGKEWEGPALNKTPLVKWERSFAFLKSAHQLWPFYLNEGSSGEHSISGALLHAKLLADFIDKLRSEQNRRQHSDEYDAYIDRIDDDPEIFYGDQSRLYVDWRSLVRDGLILDPLSLDKIDSFVDTPFRTRVF